MTKEFERIAFIQNKYRFDKYTNEGFAFLKRKGYKME